MRLLASIILTFAANAFAVLAATYFIPGVQFNWGNNFIILVEAAAVITAINLFLKPIAKLLLGPFILLSLGLVALLLNAALLWLATLWVPQLSFATLYSLLLASLLFGAINFIFSWASHKE